MDLEAGVLTEISIYTDDTKLFWAGNFQVRKEELQKGVFPAKGMGRKVVGVLMLVER